MVDLEKTQRLAERKEDKELRKLISEVKKKKRIVKNSIRKDEQKLSEKKQAFWNLDFIERELKYIRGKKKGENCPALTHKNTPYGRVWECRARDTYTLRRSLNEIYIFFCQSCRLTHEEAKTKCVFKGVFER